MRPRLSTALILGVSGQDGAYLAEFLVKRGLEVHGTSRDKEISSYTNLRQLGIFDRVTFHSPVLGDFRSVVTVLNNVRPAYIFNLAAQSSVSLSFEQPVETIDSVMHGTINVMGPCGSWLWMQSFITPAQANASATQVRNSQRMRPRYSIRAAPTL